MRAAPESTPAATQDTLVSPGGLRALFAFFRTHQVHNAPLVLATVIGAAGATYRKPGAQMLIRTDDRWQGLLSGGCLEGDLAAHAREVLATGSAKIVSYELAAMTDAVWGFGLGCDGSVRILLQRLDAANGWEPFSSLMQAVEKAHAGQLLLSLENGLPELPLASWSLRRATFAPAGTLPDVQASPALTSNAGELDLIIGGRACRCFRMPIPQLQRLVIFGGGPDAQPIVQFASQLGWHVSLADHRPAYADPARFPTADRVMHVPDQRLPADFDLSPATAIVIMSHNLAADERYLAAAVASQAPYIGLLGPGARKQKLLASLADPAAAGNRVHGPVGLDLGGEGPEAIALAIVAEIQAVIHGKRNVTR